MLKFLRKRASPLIYLICCVFIALQLSGAHAHRLVAGAHSTHERFGVAHVERARSAHVHDHHHDHLQQEDTAPSVQYQDVELAARSNPAHVFGLDWTAWLAFVALAVWLLASRVSSPMPEYRPPRSSALSKYAWPPFRGPPVPVVS